MRKKEEIILVFHHPEIVHISSTLLEGKYPDRRLINIKSESEISRHETEIVKIISNLISKIM
jgi:hypothetical protein